ncbi:hypothetical protein P3X46_013740 [Hevea brasiliensis]|uniref:Uncharacterized protein n=1 Tax=Hevea brasiliensis TaxID=3981 RepID=A0ABQ9M8C9_HEVBR|nr:hypothetical protein P3X46_013740 [Hevea brasiliensis]
MEERSIFIIFILFSIILIHSSSVHSRALSLSPSPEPVISDINLSKRRGGPGKRMKGSFLLNGNQSATNATPAYLFKYRYVTAMEVEENEYYHQVWKCISGEDIFSP